MRHSHPDLNLHRFQAARAAKFSDHGGDGPAESRHGFLVPEAEGFKTELAPLACFVANPAKELLEV